MSVNAFPAQSVTDEGGTLVFSSNVVDTGTKIPATLTAGTYSITFYGNGPLNVYSYTGTSATGLTTITATTTAPASTSFTITGTSTGLAFKGATGRVVVKSFSNGTATQITEVVSSLAACGPPNSTNYSGQSAYGNGTWVVIPHSPYSSSWTSVSKDGLFWSSASGRMPVSAQWSDIAYGNGVFVAIAGYNMYGGTGSSVAATSTDGITWVQRTLPTAVNWSRIIYANNQFLAISRSTSLVAATSPDGITWTQRTMSVARDWTDVTYGNGKYVAMSNSVNAAYSTDGITWTAATIPTSASWSRVVWDGTYFVAINSNYVTNTARSTDGITWTSTTGYPTNSNSYAYNNLYAFGSTIIALNTNHGSYYYSYSINSGSTWAQAYFYSSSATQAVSMMSNGTRYWNIDTNMANASTTTTPTVSGSFKVVGMGSPGVVSAAYGNGKWIACPNSNTQSFQVSTDLYTWTSVMASGSFSANWRSIQYFNGLFIAIPTSGTQYVTSPDGVTWTTRSGLTSGVTNWGYPVQGNGAFVLPSNTSGYGGLTTKDGINWVSGIPAGVTPYVGYSNGKFITALTSQATSSVYVSNDGIAWSSATIPTSITISGINAINGMYFIVGNGTNYYSYDCTTWFPMAGAPGNFGSVYSGGRYITSNSNNFIISNDGKTWNSVTTTVYPYAFGNSNGLYSYWFEAGQLNNGVVVSLSSSVSLT